MCKAGIHAGGGAAEEEAANLGGGLGTTSQIVPRAAECFYLGHRATGDKCVLCPVCRTDVLYEIQKFWSWNLSPLCLASTTK